MAKEKISPGLIELIEFSLIYVCSSYYYALKNRSRNGLNGASELPHAQWFCMCQFENSEKGSPKVLEIQNFNKINCFYDFLDIWPKFWAFFGFFGLFIYKPPYKNFWKKI